MELTSLTSQAVPRAVNPGAGSHSRRDQSGQEGQRPPAETRSRHTTAAHEDQKRTDHSIRRHNAEQPSRSETWRHDLDPLQAHAQTRRAQDDEHDKPSRVPEVARADRAPGTMARRAERSYLAHVPAEQGRIIDEMV